MKYKQVCFLRNKVPSLSIFFPFYNDAGTVAKAIDNAYRAGHEVTGKLEVIALHGGNSKDNTYEEILKAKKKHPSLVIVNKKDNWEGYAVIKYGLAKASKDWVFYTDGDLQYHLDELKKLVEAQNKTGADVINGYKVRRSDNVMRVWLGDGYKIISRLFFQLPIRDTDCDYRLINTKFLKKIKLEAHDASILPEMIKKLQSAGATFAEIPVKHYSRVYGQSNYTFWELFSEKLIGDVKLYFKLRKLLED